MVFVNDIKTGAIFPSVVDDLTHISNKRELNEYRENNGKINIMKHKL